MEGRSPTYSTDADEWWSKSARSRRWLDHAHGSFQDTLFVYDNANRLTQQTAKNTTGSGDEVTQYVYNLLNEVAQVTDAEGNVTRSEYDAAGNLKKVTQAFGSSMAYVSEFTYDKRNRIATRTDQDIALTIFTYTKTGKVETITDPMKNVTTFAYDAMNRAISTTDAENEIAVFQYDGERQFDRQGRSARARRH